MKNNPKRLRYIRAVCHFSVSPISEINEDVEKRVERKRMRKNPPIPNVLQVIPLSQPFPQGEKGARYNLWTLSPKKLKKMSPERMLKNMTFVNSKFPETESEKWIPSVGRRFPCTRGSVKNRRIRRSLVRCIGEKLSLEFPFPLSQLFPQREKGASSKLCSHLS